MSAHRIRLSTILFALAAWPTAARADLFTDNFESYAAGTFPSANWTDTGPIAPYSNSNTPPPTPSCVVGQTADAFGQTTRALHLSGSWVGAASGVYRPVAHTAQYSVSMDVRTDEFASGATDNPSDWPWMMGVSRYDAAVQAGGWNSLQMYGTDLARDFRAYGINDAGQQDFELGLPILAGVWYRVQIDVDADGGSIRNRIWDIAGGALLADTTTSVAGWLPTDNVFDVVTINQGELSALTSADVWVDNVSINAIPEPGSIALGLLGGLLLARRGRALAA